MAKRCEICGKGPVVGRTVSHAHNVGPRRFEPNLQTVRAIVKGATKRIKRLHAMPPRWQDHQGASLPPKRSAKAEGGDRRARRAQGDRAVFSRHPAGNLLFLSGQIPIDPATGTLVDGDIAIQTEQVMRNIGALLEAAGAGFSTWYGRRCSSPT